MENREHLVLWRQACNWIYQLEHGLFTDDLPKFQEWLEQPGAARCLEEAFVTEVLVMCHLHRMMRLNVIRLAFPTCPVKPGERASPVAA